MSCIPCPYTTVYHVSLDIISAPTRVQYTLAAVFLRVNKIRPAVYHLQLLCKSLFINLYTQQKSRQISLSGLKINIRVATGNFYFSDSSLKLFIIPSTPAEKVDAVCAPMENIS